MSPLAYLCLIALAAVLCGVAISVWQYYRDLRGWRADPPQPSETSTDPSNVWESQAREGQAQSTYYTPERVMRRIAGEADSRGLRQADKGRQP